MMGMACNPSCGSISSQGYMQLKRALTCVPDVAAPCVLKNSPLRIALSSMKQGIANIGCITLISNA
jgi:hypothetical protein